MTLVSNFVVYKVLSDKTYFLLGLRFPLKVNISIQLMTFHNTDTIFKTAEFIGSVRGSPNGTIGNFTNVTIGSQWYHWESQY